MWVAVRTNFLVEFFALLRQKTSGFPTAIGARSVQFVSRGTLRPLSARGLYPMGPGPTAIGARSRAPTRRCAGSVFSRTQEILVLRVSVTVGLRKSGCEEKSTSVDLFKIVHV